MKAEQIRLDYLGTVLEVVRGLAGGCNLQRINNIYQINSNEVNIKGDTIEIIKTGRVYCFLVFNKEAKTRGCGVHINTDTWTIKTNSQSQEKFMNNKHIFEFPLSTVDMFNISVVSAQGIPNTVEVEMLNELYSLLQELNVINTFIDTDDHEY